MVVCPANFCHAITSIFSYPLPEIYNYFSEPWQLFTNLENILISLGLVLPISDGRLQITCSCKVVFLS